MTTQFPTTQTPARLQPKRKHKPGIRQLSALNFSLLVLLWLFEQFVAENWRHTTIFIYAPQHFFAIPTLFLLVASLCKRRGKVAIFNALTAVCFAVFFLGWNVPLRSWMPQAQARDISSTRLRSLRVMTFNIECGAFGTQKIAQAVNAQNPDILCLQKTRGALTRKNGALNQAPDPISDLRKQLSPNYYMARAHEVTTFSRFPIVSQEVVLMPLATGRAILQTQLNVRGKMLTVFNAHISMTELTAREKQRDSRMPRVLQFGGSSRTRQAQVDILLKETAKTRTPFLVCGDFNTPPRGKVYRSLARHMTDSFRAAGWGSGFSFRSDWPLMRIDYIWTSSQLRVLDCQIPNVHASDHRPCVADLKMG